jgi:hypothetical protein
MENLTYDDNRGLLRMERGLGFPHTNSEFLLVSEKLVKFGGEAFPPIMTSLLFGDICKYF